MTGSAHALALGAAQARATSPPPVTHVVASRIAVVRRANFTRWSVAQAVAAMMALG